LRGNPATEFFLTFALLAAVLGTVSKFAGGTHLRLWRNDSLAAAGSLSDGTFSKYSKMKTRVFGVINSYY
ncbi:unnamed protein product, partial [Ilex paraguariensis]